MKQFIVLSFISFQLIAVSAFAGAKHKHAKKEVSQTQKHKKKRKVTMANFENSIKRSKKHHRVASHHKVHRVIFSESDPKPIPEDAIEEAKLKEIQVSHSGLNVENEIMMSGMETREVDISHGENE